MKILIASDIHGSAFYCRKLIERITEEQPDRILLLGDILYHGPRNALPAEYDPPAVCDMLNPLADKILCVRGNCDGEVDGMVLKFPVLCSYALIADGDFTFTAVHGHHLDDGTVLVPPYGGTVLYGHTHVPCDTLKDGVRYINPGSVSIPKENSPHSYILYQNGTFTWKDVTTGEKYR